MELSRKTVGQGQHGTARFATKAEVKKTYTQVPFDVENWRKGRNLPTVQGTVVGCRTHGKKTVALVDEGDVHTLMVGAAGIGKTAIFSLSEHRTGSCKWHELSQYRLQRRRFSELQQHSEKVLRLQRFCVGFKKSDKE